MNQLKIMTFSRLNQHHGKFRYYVMQEVNWDECIDFTLANFEAKANEREFITDAVLVQLFARQLAKSTVQDIYYCFP